MSTFSISQPHKQKVFGAAQAGQVAAVKLHEFGGVGQAGEIVELRADGKVDEFVRKASFGEPCDLDDPRLRRFVSRAEELTRQFQPGGSQSSNFCESQVNSALKTALKACGLNGNPYSRKDDRGYVQMDGSLTDSQGYIVQSFDIQRRGSQSTVRLSTSLSSGGGRTIHRMEAPIQPDASPDLSRVQESLEVRVPWFSEFQLKGMSQEAIQDISDPRLGKIVEAADLGRRLDPEALGSGWSLSEGKNCQLFSHKDQTVRLDLLQGSALFQILHGAGDGYSNAVHCQNGKFQRGTTRDGVQFGIVYGNSTY